MIQRGSLHIGHEVRSAHDPEARLSQPIRDGCARFSDQLIDRAIVPVKASQSSKVIVCLADHCPLSCLRLLFARFDVPWTPTRPLTNTKPADHRTPSQPATSLANTRVQPASDVGGNLDLPIYQAALLVFPATHHTKDLMLTQPFHQPILDVPLTL